jgi:hypothetical protein
VQLLRVGTEFVVSAVGTTINFALTFAAVKMMTMIQKTTTTKSVAPMAQELAPQAVD